MRRWLNLLPEFLPFAYFPAMAWVVFDDRATFDLCLAGAFRGAAAVDIIGFGFWFNWILLSVPFAAICLITFACDRRDARYWATVVATYLAVTAIGAYYGLRLESHVLAGGCQLI